MPTRQYRKTGLSRLIVPALTMSFLAYFALHAQSGRYGSESKTLLTEELAKRTADYDAIVEQRHALEQRVQLLRDGSLERDMIDERARAALNMVTTDELVILR